MPGDNCRLAYLYRAERTGDFQIQLRSGNQEMKLALRQQRVLGIQKQTAEVHVRSPVVALAGLAEERAGWVESAQVAQLLAKHSLPETGTSILVIMMSP